MIVKFFYYTLWTCERLECFLDKMEQNGYRLESVVFRYLFCFKKTTPKCVQYVYSFSFLKDIEMYQHERKLRQVYGANLISSKYSVGTRIHRITDVNAEFLLFQLQRNNYFRRILLQKSAFAAILAIGSVCAYVKYDACPFVIIALFDLILIACFLYGVLVLLKKRKSI